MKEIWIFNGNGSSLPAGAFETRIEADKFIQKYKLSGCLTKYPVGKSLYNWTIDEGYFEPNTEHKKTASFIEGFTSAHTEHYHYEKGKSYN